MKINIIIPFIHVTGGIKFFFEHANRLTELGHIVNVIYPLIPYYLGKSLFNPFSWVDFVIMFRNNLFTTYPNWYGKQINFKLKRVIKISNYTVPNADITIATAWPTGYDVVKLNAKKGKKVYFVLHYEIDMGIKRLVDKSYNLPIKLIALSNRTAQIISSKFNRKFVGIVTSGIDLDEFFNQYKKNNNPPRVLFYYDPSERKGGDDGLKALEIVKEKTTNFDIQIFGIKEPKHNFNNTTFIKKPVNLDKLRELYCKADIFVYPSRYEGFGMPPMEAMACKCATVTTNTGGVIDYTIPDKTAIVVPPQNPKLLADGIVKLLSDQNLLKQISFAGHNYIKNFTWEKSTKKFENLLYKILSNEIP